MTSFSDAGDISPQGVEHEKGKNIRVREIFLKFFHTTFICLFYGISRYKKGPSYHDWQLGLKLYDMEYMGINFGKEIQTETKALKVKN